MNTPIPDDVETTTRAVADVPDLGALEDFDPYNEVEWPRVPGVYVLYDITNRPMYVGKSQNIATRLRSHRDKFWWNKPIIHSASFVTVASPAIRHSLEQVLIRFLKTNAVINQQSVRRSTPTDRTASQ